MGATQRFFMLWFLFLKNAGAYEWPLSEAPNNSKITLNEFNYRRFSVRIPVQAFVTKM